MLRRPFTGTTAGARANRARASDHARPADQARGQGQRKGRAGPAHAVDPLDPPGQTMEGAQRTTHAPATASSPEPRACPLYMGRQGRQARGSPLVMPSSLRLCRGHDQVVDQPLRQARGCLDLVHAQPPSRAATNSRAVKSAVALTNGTNSVVAPMLGPLAQGDSHRGC